MFSFKLILFYFISINAFSKPIVLCRVRAGMLEPNPPSLAFFFVCFLSCICNFILPHIFCHNMHCVIHGHQSSALFSYFTPAQFICWETPQSQGLSAVQRPWEASDNEGKPLACYSQELMEPCGVQPTVNLISIMLNYLGLVRLPAAHMVGLPCVCTCSAFISTWWHENDFRQKVAPSHLFQTLFKRQISFFFLSIFTDGMF